MRRPHDIAPASGAAPTGAPAPRDEVAAFLAEARARPVQARAGTGRLIFALDATMSRQPTWDLACQLQGAMFDAASGAGRLEVQLVYFRGHGEARASRFVAEAAGLKRLMTGIACHGGLTQIGRVLEHAERTAAKAPVAALVYVGDAMEENVDQLCATAGALGLRNTRAFMFHEGGDPAAARAFREIARLTGGAYLPFDVRAAGELAALLAAVGAYAAGGRAALEATGTGAARRLLADMRA
ncbi:MAG TPA: VWA domain-containing protein [Amaricoccus sp.]|nr:VWA domain-containing protein [Amaricoccus sp.]